MPRRFIVRPLAEADLEDAARWYEDERAGLAGRFFSDVDRTFARIRERPLQFPAVSGDVRRALLHTFPYAVYFRVSDQAAIVLAALHLRRNPKIWRGRARG
jgi:plasmid stabilization system protein ParE